MRFLLILLISLIPVLPATAQEDKTYTESQFRQAAAALFASPLGPNSKEMSKTIIAWAVESPAVDVTIGPAILEITRGGEGQEEMSLLCAFIAGQSLAQLKNKVKGGYAVEGGKKVIEVYTKIQAAQPAYTNAAAEKIRAAQRDGKLEELLSK